MPDRHFDLIVLGAGTAGSACWTKARQRGKSVAVFEGGVLGGECPSFACMPTKALLHCAEVFETAKDGERFGLRIGGLGHDYARVKAHKDYVVSHTGAALGEKPYLQSGVTLVRHYARFVAEDAVEAGGERYTADRFLIATGSRQRLPTVDGLQEAGFITFKEAIDLERLPSSIAIMGGGAVGCEFAQVFSSFGVRVHIIDRNERLMHAEDPEVGDFLGEHFRRRGVEVHLRESLVSVRREGGQKRLELQSGGRESLLVDELLIATGKQPNLDIGLEAAGIELDERGNLLLDETLRTTNPRVYAAGDVAGPYRFTHAASYQGGLACHNMFEPTPLRVDYRAMPRCAFTSPEVASVGLNETEAERRGIEVKMGRADLADVDRALTSGRQAGFVKVVAAPDGTLLGGVLVCDRAGELAGELALAISLGATASQVASLVHAFPTYNEALVQACEAVAA